MSARSIPVLRVCPPGDAATGDADNAAEAVAGRALGTVTGAARPGRRAVVIGDLDELHGPVSGLIQLPHRLFWQPARSVNLDNPALLGWLYETVLREATTATELRSWLDGDTLIRLWPSLFLPRRLRQAWEARHPVLR